MDKLETREDYRKIAESLASYGTANIEMPCGEGKTTTVYIGQLGEGTPGLSDSDIRKMIEESIAINIEVLDSEEWTHLGEMPEERIEKLRRAQICLPAVEA